MRTDTIFGILKTQIKTQYTGLNVGEYGSTKLHLPVIEILVSQDSQEPVCWDLQKKIYTVTLSLVTGTTNDRQLERESLKKLEALVEYIEEYGITDGTTDIVGGEDIVFGGIAEGEEMDQDKIYNRYETSCTFYIDEVRISE